jgi:hypothetical protein
MKTPCNYLAEPLLGVRRIGVSEKILLILYILYILLNKGVQYVNTSSSAFRIRATDGI